MTYRLWVNEARTVLVYLWEDGTMTVSQRENPDHTWASIAAHLTHEAGSVPATGSRCRGEASTVTAFPEGGEAANTPAARALRALQKFDEAADVVQNAPRPSRPLFLEAQNALGEALGLTCTGSPLQIVAGEGSHRVRYQGYDHSGETCPIHEWLVDTDHFDEEDE